MATNRDTIVSVTSAATTPTSATISSSSVEGGENSHSNAIISGENNNMSSGSDSGIDSTSVSTTSTTLGYTIDNHGKNTGIRGAHTIMATMEHDRDSTTSGLTTPTIMTTVRVTWV